MGSLLNRFVSERKKEQLWGEHPFCVLAKVDHDKEAYLCGLVIVAVAANPVLHAECLQSLHLVGSSLSLSVGIVEGLIFSVERMSDDNRIAELSKTVDSLNKISAIKLFLVEALRLWVRNSGSVSDWKVFRDSFVSIFCCRNLAAEIVAFETIFLENKSIDLLRLSEMFSDDEIAYLLGESVKDARKRLGELRANENCRARFEEEVRCSRDRHRKDLAQVMDALEEVAGRNSIEDNELNLLSKRVSHIAYQNISWQIELSLLACSVSRNVSIWRMLVLALIKFRDDEVRFAELKEALQKLYVRVLKEDYEKGDVNQKRLISLVDKYFHQEIKG